ncbi:MAG: gamma-glutamyl-gamma-aminobutyrate hydrolase family protein [Bacilli bacterium]|nr:gamma-glutamyl-gamma-aminobutyrate hydrolase family protein [Bacilli bacterium]
MKIIGIVGRVYYNKDDQKIIQLNDSVRKVLTNYEDIIPILILPPNHEDYHNIKIGADIIDAESKKKLDYLLDKCDGFIVPGGTYWYKFDEYVINHAIKYNKPLLAICAGFQCLCSMYAIDRYKADMTNRLTDNNHYGEEDKYIHKNIIVKDTLLSRIVGKDIIKVNSIHHDYVDFEMKDLIISSYSEDNIIEAVELPNHSFLIGLEWHPEYLMDEDSKKIFDYFIKVVKR